MLSQGDQLLNQLKQYDLRKNQLKSSQSFNSLNNQFTNSNNNNSTSNSNIQNSLVNNGSGSFTNLNSVAEPVSGRSPSSFNQNLHMSPSGYNGSPLNNSASQVNVGQVDNDHVIQDKSRDGNVPIQFSLGNDDDDQEDEEEGDDDETYKLLGNNSLIPGYEPFNSTQELVQHTYTSLKILDRRPRFVPPINFSTIENDIYRSGHPQPNNFEFLETLNLKTIIYLGDKTDNYDYYKWIKENNDVNERKISFRYFKMQPPSSFSDGSKNHAFNDKVALNTILNLVLNKQNYPILIHSNKGKHRVGVLVGLIRRFLQGWSLSGTFDEYGKFAREKGEGDLEFIEMFKPILKADLDYLPSFVRID